MKKAFVQTFRILLCAGSIAACAAASPSISIAITVDHQTQSTWRGIVYSGQNGGVLAEVADFSNNNKRVARGTFSTVSASANPGGVNSLLIFDETDLGNSIGTIPVNSLSFSGTSAANIFILEIDSGGASLTFRSMSGGLPGTVSDLDVWESNDKILFVGDFGSAGSLTYADFRIWDIGNVAWDTYTMIINGYDGYWPDHIERESTDTWKVRLSTVANAYGGYTDDDGWESFPWTTQWVKWDISLARWVGYL